MLKKGVLLLVMSSFLFASCNFTSISSEQVAQGPVQKPAPAQNNADKPTGLTYDVTNKTYTYQGTTITYPQIQTTDAKQNPLNQLIRSEALKGLAYYSGYDTDLTLDIKYELKQKGTRFLSIQYTGVGYVKGAAYPNNRFYTTNIDLEKGEKVRLPDIVKIDQTLLETVKAGKWKPLRPEHEGLLQSYSDDELMKKLVEADMFGKTDTFSYVTPNAVGISISVPHVLGDHAEFEISYQDLATHLQIKPE